ncbi:hypothetical protein ACFL6I_19735 [candidate division KSB1 bacterium]
MKNILYIIIALGLFTGFIFSELDFFRPAVPYLIGLLLFLNFLEFQPKWERLFRMELLITLFLSALFMPLLVYYVLSRGMIIEYRIGLFFTAIAPSGIMMLVLSRFVPQKDYNLIISNFLATQFGVIIYLPLMTELVLGASVSINVSYLFFQTAALVLVPFTASSLARNFTTADRFDSLRVAGSKIIPVLVYSIISVSVSGAAQEIQWNPDLIKISILVFLIYTIQGGLGYIGGFAFNSRSIRNSLTLAASSRNIQLVLGLALINFPPLTVVPMVIGIIFHHITNAMWLWLFRK